MNFDNRELEKAFKESERQQALLQMNYLDRFLNYHSEIFGEAALIIYTFEVALSILLYTVIMSIHASGNTECYYEESFYTGDTYVVASIDWREDRNVFVSKDYSEVKDYLFGKEMCK